jgi:hypothetical protein
MKWDSVIKTYLVYTDPVYNNTRQSKVTADWLAILLRIREVLASNLGPETGYPVWGISWISSVSPGKWRGGTLN